MDLKSKYIKLKEKAEQIFQNNPLIYCPYFREQITLNSDGFHHLRYSARRERNKNEQTLKFSLMPLAIQVIRKSGTIQEYRKTIAQTGKRSERDGLAPMKTAEYWGLIAILGERSLIKIRVVLRRIGDGKTIFWSVMPAIKLTKDKLKIIQNLAKKGIEDD